MAHEWKAGMAVALWKPFSRVPERHVIHSVTPAGFCRLREAGPLWNKSGYERGSSSRFSPSRIEPWTDDHAAKIATFRAERITRTIRDAMIALPRDTTDAEIMAAVAAWRAKPKEPA